MGDAKNSNPNKFVGKYLDHSEWNTLLEDDDVVLIDTRNYYETSIGTFKNSLIPDIDNFKEFPNFVEKLKPIKIKKLQCSVRVELDVKRQALLCFKMDLRMSFI